jgi:hypothetical protein
MGVLKADISNVDGKLVVLLTGQIDEDVKLPSADFSSGSEVIFDFEGLTLINSCGIRDWVTWMKSIPAGKPVSFVNCPSILIDQVNMISGFVPASGKIGSFYVPYFCDECDDLKNILFTKGKEFDGEKCEVKEEIACPTCGEEAELDVIKLKYFKFLKNFG